jgi:GNAT superfamily N-acetyltransferase
MAHIAEQVEIRPLRDEDFEAVAEIATANFPDEPHTAQETRDQYARFDERRFSRGWIVAEERGQVMAYGFWSHVWWSFHPDKYHVYASVHPRAHRRGIGTTMLTHLLRRLGERGATRLKSWALDLTPFEGYARRAEAAGAEITTLKDELRADPNRLGAVYQSHCALDIGTPHSDPDLPTPPRFERWVEDEVRSPRALRDAYFLVKMGDLYIGESVLQRYDAGPGVLWQHLTAVHPEYRGHGIATALKVRTVEYAQIMGYREIRTFNSSKNAPMLAINTKLGFVRQPAWIDFLRAERA